MLTHKRLRVLARVSVKASLIEAGSLFQLLIGWRNDTKWLFTWATLLGLLSEFIPWTFCAPGWAIAGSLGVLSYSSRVINHSLHPHTENLDLSVFGVLIVTLQVLGLSPTRTDGMVEHVLPEHVEEDLPSSQTPETLEKWRDRSETGLRNHPRARENKS